jgi:hypothetical protein
METARTGKAMRRCGGWLGLGDVEKWAGVENEHDVRFLSLFMTSKRARVTHVLYFMIKTSHSHIFCDHINIL